MASVRFIDLFFYSFSSFGFRGGQGHATRWWRREQGGARTVKKQKRRGKVSVSQNLEKLASRESKFKCKHNLLPRFIKTPSN